MGVRSVAEYNSEVPVMESNELTPEEQFYESFEFSPEAGLIFETEVWLAGGIPVEPETYFDSSAELINDGSPEFLTKLKQTIENVGGAVTKLETFADFVTALQASKAA